MSLPLKGYCPKCYRKTFSSPAGEDYCTSCGFLYPEPPAPLLAPSDKNNGRCKRCRLEGVKHRTAIICPKCRDCLGGF